MHSASLPGARRAERKIEEAHWLRAAAVLSLPATSTRKMAVPTEQLCGYMQPEEEGSAPPAAPPAGVATTPSA